MCVCACIAFGIKNRLYKLCLRGKTAHITTQASQIPPTSSTPPPCSQASRASAICRDRVDIIASVKRFCYRLSYKRVLRVVPNKPPRWGILEPRSYTPSPSQHGQCGRHTQASTRGRAAATQQRSKQHDEAILADSSSPTVMPTCTFMVSLSSYSARYFGTCTWAHAYHNRG